MGARLKTERGLPGMQGLMDKVKVQAEGAGTCLSKVCSHWGTSSPPFPTAFLFFPTRRGKTSELCPFQTAHSSQTDFLPWKS